MQIKHLIHDTIFGDFHCNIIFSSIYDRLLKTVWKLWKNLNLLFVLYNQSILVFIVFQFPALPTSLFIIFLEQFSLITVFLPASPTFVIQQLDRPFSQITSYLNYYLVDLRKTDQENQRCIYNNTIVDIFLLNTEAFSLDT